MYGILMRQTFYGEMLMWVTLGKGKKNLNLKVCVCVCSKSRRSNDGDLSKADLNDRCFNEDLKNES